MLLPLGILLPTSFASFAASPGHSTPPRQCACCYPWGMLFPSGHAAVPWASCATCGRSPVKPIYFEAGSSCSSSFQLSKKVTVLGGKISSQNRIERLLISSPPSKRTLKQKKANFFVYFFFSRF
jgi:hypothetical protein